MDDRRQFHSEFRAHLGDRDASAAPKLEEGAQPSSTRRLSKNCQNASEIDYSPERAVKADLKMVKVVERSLSKLTINNPLREVVWNKAITELQAAKENKPTTLIAVCGATGAGKSSILNAVLDDNIVPTSGMRACTSVVTKISHHKSREIRAEVSFLALEEWRQEIRALLGDWASHVDEANVSGKPGDPREEAKIAWEKVHAVYPGLDQEDLDDMTEQELFDHDPRVTAKLGTVETVIASDSTEFGKKISKYIDSVNRDENAMEEEPDEKLALWPLIREVHVFCKAKALSTGAVLVDLPGVADANVARANIAKEYLKKAKYIWILAPITRAVDDQTAQKLLGDAFQRQLLMDGTYNSQCITFIASKTDDVSCSEVVRALRLSTDPEYRAIQNQIKDVKRRQTQVDEKKNALAQPWRETDERHEAVKLSRDNLQMRIEALETRTMATWTTLSSASGSRGVGIKRKVKQPSGGKPGASKVRRRKKGEETDSSDSSSDSDSDSRDELDFSGDDVDAEYEEVTPELEDVHDPVVLRNRLQELDHELAALEVQLEAHHAEGMRIADEKATLESESNSAQRDKNAFCAKKRNEFAKERLKEDFRIGLRKLEENEAEKRDGAAFDPTQNTRDYSLLDLPVFAVSSRDYVRSKGQVDGDGAATCFTSAEDTEISAVQQWCHTLTFPQRHSFAISHLKKLLCLAKGVETYVEHVHVTGGAAAAHRLQLAYSWDSNKVHVTGREGVTERLLREFSQLAVKCSDHLNKSFKESIAEKCREGAKVASESAIEIIEKFGAIHHATYRATMKRYGTWKRDINLELVDPFTQTIAQSFSKMFQKDIFGPFEIDVVNCIALLLQDFLNSTAAELKPGAMLQQKACRKEMRAALSRTMDAVKETMSAQRKEISRSISPLIQKCLMESYENAKKEKGKGSVARIKAHFHTHVEQRKDSMFEEAADTILVGLDNAAKAVGDTLKSTLSELAETVEVNLAVIWEDIQSGEEEAAARADALDVMSKTKTQASLWLKAAGEDDDHEDT